jgi:hypothetical protein
VPVLLIVIWHIAFIAWGCNSLYEDQGLHVTPFLFASQNQITDHTLAACAGAVHLWKYAFMNVFVASFAVLTYFFFPAGGEGARARAMLLTILHLGLAAWGMLIWNAASPTCQNVIASHFGDLYSFSRVCIWHNAVLFSLFLAHEAYLGDELGADLTIVAIFNKESSMAYDYYQAEPDMAYVAGAAQPTSADAALSNANGDMSAMAPVSSAKTPSRELHAAPPSLDLYTEDQPLT